jgi:hypothetical protein
MYLPRKSLFSLTLLGALFGTPALASVHAAGAPGGFGHPPVIQVATLPQRVRLRRRVRRARLRLIVLRAGRGVGGAAAMIRAGRTGIQPRLPPHDCYARGPPRSSGA